jgi:hypothetical protein
MVYMASMPVSPLTEEQYLQIERKAVEKSDFHDGQMFAMSGRLAEPRADFDTHDGDARPPAASRLSHLQLRFADQGYRFQAAHLPGLRGFSRRSAI